MEAVNSPAFYRCHQDLESSGLPIPHTDFFLGISILDGSEFQMFFYSVL